MFIRIKERPLKTSDGHDCSLRVYLVENRRIDGQPRQRVLLYLGSISKSLLSHQQSRAQFLRKANRQITEYSSDYLQSDELKRELVQILLKRYIEPIIDIGPNSAYIHFLRLWHEGRASVVAYGPRAKRRVSRDSVTERR